MQSLSWVARKRLNLKPAIFCSCGARLEVLPPARCRSLQVGREEKVSSYLLL